MYNSFLHFIKFIQQKVIYSRIILLKMYNSKRWYCKVLYKNTMPNLKLTKSSDSRFITSDDKTDCLLIGDKRS